MAQIDAFFKMMHDLGASDLHLSSGSQPIIRLHGDMQRVKYKILEHDELKKLLYEITPENKIKQFEETGDVDFSYEVPHVARYRANFFMQKRGIGAVFREIPQKILTVDELGLPPILKNLAMLPKGLVLVTGPTGSGKSTTLAAIIDYANKMRKDHILTIEDPIEFVHEPQNCLINQREVGRDTLSFNAALRGALREDPDIILVGEMRDLETIQLALEAAETGHLVFGTLHTISASKTIDRIIEVFPGDLQGQVRSGLADSLRAIVAQNLFKRVDKPGRCAALEILIALPAVRNLIRENKIFQINSVIETGKKYGMQSLDDAIMQLLMAGKIDAEQAYNKAVNKSKFRDFLTTPPQDFTEV
ncbi:MAG: twitching motility protein [Desulfomicrobiaceae bacterium]|jgi:twitching motility protein PilT|nr:type IV pilus twitching motility protein PilT [Desulfomicrobiaceae bacterium]MBZ4647779.1 twitching motility protein [Desulfomicrobiaceae bacterium]MBZ4684970.1 twitching motility protein [Desulfomicrobiaceae bacterium]MDI3492529.1 twitching motility protein PilT [Desulfomicrobiaceae bacterium]MDK2872572.1 twitching motility protein PilT [Desulfomicrobiaceae bacterium]